VSLSFAQFKIPPYKYYPRHLTSVQGPKQWAQLRFLQACERLDIPSRLCPRFPNFHPPMRDYQHSYRPPERFQLPEFNVLNESEAEWRERARKLFEEMLDKHTTILKGSVPARCSGWRVCQDKTDPGEGPA
jgi:hypothetical protein